MNFIEFKEKIKDKPYSENIKFDQAIMWVHPEILPLGVVSIGEDDGGVIKIPSIAKNSFGKEVYVIAISKNAFAGHDKITDIVLPATIEKIPQGAFAGCSSLKRITIPKNIKSIREGTFDGCANLEDIYFEGTREEWETINIIYQRHEIEFGPLIPGTPIQEIKSEQLVHVPGNDAVLKCNIHFHCSLSDLEKNPVFKLSSGGRDVTDLFRIM